MTNLTLTIDDDVLRRARIRALEQRTSVNALIREYLEAYSGAAGRRQRAVARIVALSKEASSGSGGRRWTRDELHER